MMSKTEASVRGKPVSRLTQFELYWLALGFRRKYAQVCTATIRQKSGAESSFTIHGDHKRAVFVASYLFYLGRPGIKPEQIETIEVRGPGLEHTSLWCDNEGDVVEGAPMLCGTLADFARRSHEDQRALAT